MSKIIIRPKAIIYLLIILTCILNTKIAFTAESDPPLAYFVVDGKMEAYHWPPERLPDPVTYSINSTNTPGSFEFPCYGTIRSSIYFNNHSEASILDYMSFYFADFNATTEFQGAHRHEYTVKIYLESDKSTPYKISVNSLGISSIALYSGELNCRPCSTCSWDCIGGSGNRSCWSIYAGGYYAGKKIDYSYDTSINIGGNIYSIPPESNNTTGLVSNTKEFKGMTSREYITVNGVKYTYADMIKVSTYINVSMGDWHSYNANSYYDVTTNISVVRDLGQPPVAVISNPPTQLSANQTGTFDGSSSYDPDSDGSIVEHKWTFQRPDGYNDTRYGATVDYSWGEPGTYTVALRVTDNNGMVDTKAIDVSILSCNIDISISDTDLWPYFPQGNDTDEKFRATIDITSSNPAPTDGCLVQLDIIPQSFSGHDHTPAGFRPSGAFPDTPTEIDGSNTTNVVFNSGEVGTKKAYYRASEIAGTEKIRALYDGNQIFSNNVNIRVPNLIGLSCTKDGEEICNLTGSTSKHQNNHFGTSNTIKNIEKIAEDFLSQYQAKLGINDISLESGGMFDICGTFKVSDTCPNAPSGGHSSHRKGKGFDVDSCAEAISEQNDPSLRGNCNSGYIRVLKDDIEELCQSFNGWLARESTIHCNFR